MRARVRRQRLVAVFALNSVVVWMSAVWPQLMSVSVRGAVLWTWLLVFAGVASVRLREWHLGRHLRRLLSELAPPGLS